jgi:hypothetical protein
MSLFFSIEKAKIKELHPPHKTKIYAIKTAEATSHNSGLAKYSLPHTIAKPSGHYAK